MEIEEVVAVMVEIPAMAAVATVAAVADRVMGISSMLFLEVDIAEAQVWPIWFSLLFEQIITICYVFIQAHQVVAVSQIF